MLVAGVRLVLEDDHGEILGVHLERQRGHGHSGDGHVLARHAQRRVDHEHHLVPPGSTRCWAIPFPRFWVGLADEGGGVAGGELAAPGLTQRLT